MVVLRVKLRCKSVRNAWGWGKYIWRRGHGGHRSESGKRWWGIMTWVRGQRSSGWRWGGKVSLPGAIGALWNMTVSAMWGSWGSQGVWKVPVRSVTGKKTGQTKPLPQSIEVSIGTHGQIEVRVIWWGCCWRWGSSCGTCPWMGRYCGCGWRGRWVTPNGRVPTSGSPAPGTSPSTGFVHWPVDGGLSAGSVMLGVLQRQSRKMWGLKITNKIFIFPSWIKAVHWPKNCTKLKSNQNVVQLQKENYSSSESSTSSKSESEDLLAKCLWWNLKFLDQSQCCHEQLSSVIRNSYCILHSRAILYSRQSSSNTRLLQEL